MLSLRDVVVNYGKDSENNVLNGVSMELKEEKIVIVGPNGSGKTTLLKAILGLVRLKSGSIEIFGKDITSLKNQNGVTTNLVDVYNLVRVPVIDIVKLFCELLQVSDEKPFRLFEEFGLKSILRKRLTELSSGQKKIFGNIMAFSLNPRIILLDEPFESVDEARKKRLVDLLKESGSEIILITHEFNMLEKLGSWGMYFMLEGRLWGKFETSMLDRLYITRGEVTDALQVMDTSIGKLSITLDHGDVAVRTASNMTALLEKV